MEIFLFINFSLFALLGALGLLFFRVPIHSALSLLLTLISIAGLYLLLDAKTLFMIQIVVYAGAIMVLSVFVMMFFNISPDLLLVRFPNRWPICLLGAFIIFGFLFAGIWDLGLEFASSPEGFGEIKPLGIYLFKHWGLSFEAVSLLLTAALIGVVVSSKGKDDV